MSDLHRMPGHLIRRAQQIAWALFASECGGYDLTSVQYAALRMIAETPGVDATRLSALIAFDRSTIGDVLERLEAKGWVRRTPGPADRRVKLLSLTPAGAGLLREVEPAVGRVQRRILEPLAEHDRVTMVRLLGELVATASGHAATGDDMTRPYLVAGAGIGGLAAALGLAQKGVDVIVLEKAHTLGEIGAGIQLGPNAFHSFDYLGIGDAARAMAVYVDQLRMMDAMSGEEICHIPVAARSASVSATRTRWCIAATCTA